METRLVGLKQVPSITEVASRGNELLGKEAPGNPSYIVVKITHVQVLQQPNGYDALLLVEVDQQEPLNLKAADVEYQSSSLPRRLILRRSREHKHRKAFTAQYL